MNEVRLHVFLARCGIGSRRACERLIEQGRVELDGQVVRDLGVRIRPEQAEVRLDGRAVRLPQMLVYLAVNKPVGVTSTCRDPYAERTILGFVPRDLASVRLYPVGRLDRDSEGLVLLTNDGRLAHRVMHPSRHVAKTYEVELVGPWDEAMTEAWRRGIRLEDGPTAPAEVEVRGRAPDGVQLRVTLHEGRKRQIRRMALASGCRVRRLVRTAIGSLALGELPSGAARALNASEVQALYQAAGLEEPCGEGRPSC